MAFNYGQQAAQQAAQMAAQQAAIAQQAHQRAAHQAAQGHHNFVNHRQNYRAPRRRGLLARFFGLVLKLIVVAVFLLVVVSLLSGMN